MNGAEFSNQKLWQEPQAAEAEVERLRAELTAANEKWVSERDEASAMRAARDRLAETGAWLVRCLKDVNAGKPVRGLDEAITAWEAALSVLDRR